MNSFFRSSSSYSFIRIRPKKLFKVIFFQIELFMNKQRELCGWQIHHHEQLFFRANTGALTIRLKFFHYPSYRQTVTINQSPAHCKLKTKRNNTFFLFQQKVRTKGTISLERIISVYPQTSILPVNKTWGRISDISRLLQRKYKQSFSYWPMSSSAIQDISQERWFATDDLCDWTQIASRYIIMKIKHPEKQEKRLGADQALRTGSGDCDEFTDLFITLARIRGIPCRRLTGYFIHQMKMQNLSHMPGEKYYHLSSDGFRLTLRYIILGTIPSIM